MSNESPHSGNTGNPLLSILLPVVKTEFFQEAFRSAANQTFSDYEIVVLDNKADGDTSFTQEDPRTRLIKNEERIPMVENINKGMSLCRGTWIHILCDDDVIDKTLLECIAGFILKHGDETDIIRTRFIRINENKEVLCLADLARDLATLDEYIYESDSYFCLSFFTVRRETALAVGGFRSLSKSIWSDDKDFFARVAERKNRIGSINEILVTHRENSNNLSLKPLSYNEATQRLIASDMLYKEVRSLLEKHESPITHLAINKSRQALERQAHHFFKKNLKKNGILSTWKLYRTFHKRNRSMANHCIIWLWQETILKIMKMGMILPKWIFKLLKPKRTS